MQLDSATSALTSALNTPIAGDPVGQMLQVAQVSVLKKVIQTQDDLMRTLLASLSGVGKHLDVTG